MHNIRKAIIPVAGFGTRLLPATKAQPKCMLPIVDKPIIQYIVEEVAAAKINNISFILGRDQHIVENHFDATYELENVLKCQGKLEQLSEIQKITDLGKFTYIRQKEMYGLGHAVLCAQHIIEDEPFALLLGDNIFDSSQSTIKTLIDVFITTGKSVVGVQQVPIEDTRHYGIINTRDNDKSHSWQIKSIIEKPIPQDAPSQWAIIGRYILSPNIFSYLTKRLTNNNKEHIFTDALTDMAKDKQLIAVALDAKYYDTGNTLGYIKANIDYGLKKQAIRKELLNYIHNLILQNNK